MINRVNTLPRRDGPFAETVKLENLFYAYKDEIQLFVQTKTGAVISLLSGDAIISGKAEAEELKQFLSFLRPRSVFSAADNLTALYGADGFEQVNVLMREKPAEPVGNNTFLYDFSSKEAYDLLNDGGFGLPPYEYFATDYCRRKNMGLIKIFGKRGECIAVTLEGDEHRLLSGIVSKTKGSGGALLLSAIGGEKPVLTVCRDELLPFYGKFGFTPLYKAGYWRKYD